MNPAKEPKDRRQDKQQRLRYAIRKANDRMFAVLESPQEPAKAKPEEPVRH
jgi:hypothetical protein